MWGGLKGGFVAGPGAPGEAARNARLLKTGLAGTLVAAVCCFTPVLALLFGAVGLSAWLGYADYVLWPALAVFLALTAYALARQRRLQQPRN
jgi:mercuric ion transport protein